MMPSKGSSKEGEWHRQISRRRLSSVEEPHAELAQYLRAAFIHFRGRDLTFRRALNRVRREGAHTWSKVAGAADKANERKIADAIQSIDPFRRVDSEAHESSRLESELAVAENTERNELARYLCAAFYKWNWGEWGFDRILATVSEDPGSAWRSVADLAVAAEARQTTVH